MALLGSIICKACLVGVLYFHFTDAQARNPTILQDSRNLPKTDGTFGFLYRTEDGIAHGAVGEPGGQVHGRFTYTDPTGLKVNYNYNAGSQVKPGYNYDNKPASSARYDQAEQATNYETDQPRANYNAQAPRVRYNPASSARYRDEGVVADSEYRQKPRPVQYRTQPAVQYSAEPSVSINRRPTLRNNIDNSYDY